MVLLYGSNHSAATWGLEVKLLLFNVFFSVNGIRYKYCTIKNDVIDQNGDYRC